VILPFLPFCSEPASYGRILHPSLIASLYRILVTSLSNLSMWQRKGHAFFPFLLAPFRDPILTSPLLISHPTKPFPLSEERYVAYKSGQKNNQNLSQLKDYR
jgi:hypothetical protein